MSKRKFVLANNPLLSGPKLEDRERVSIPYREIRVESVQRDEMQPRAHFDETKLNELADSIRNYGVLSPILVRRGDTTGSYKLVSGERRLRAAKIIGLQTVPAIVDQDEDSSGERTLAMQLVENLQRTDLAVLERAQAIAALRDNYGLSVREVAERLSMSKSSVQRSLEMLDLPADLIHALKSGASESKVLLLSKITDQEVRAGYLRDLEIVTREQLQEQMSSKDGLQKTRAVRPEDDRISEEIQRAIGLKVKLMRGDLSSERGKLTIEFYSEEDLQEVFRLLVAKEGLRA